MERAEDKSMKRTLKRRRRGALAASCLAGVCLMIYPERRGTTGVPAGTVSVAECDPIFSETGSFYENSIQVNLRIDGAEEIYYTLDGSVPDTDSNRYEAPVELEAGEDLNVYTLRAVGYAEGERQDQVHTHTYFLGKNVNQRHADLIVSITGDPEGLFGAEDGILVGGRVKEEYLAAHPEEPDAAAPANYYDRGFEAEREVHVELLEPDGTALVSQDAGLRVHGGVSRSQPQKSLRLIARKRYGTKYFEAPLFGEKESSYYKKLVLRNSGNDYMLAFERNECALSLAADAGFPDTTRFRTAAVYINGAYYGFEWLSEVFDDTYFERKYDTADKFGSWEILEVKNRLLSEEDEEEKSTKRAIRDWNAIYTLCTTQDLTDDRVFALFTEQVDVENFLLYHAIEIYLANPDWPFNNNKVYRWYPEDGSYGEESTDGKWRFLMYDFDEGLGKRDSSAPTDLSLSKALGLEDSGHWKRYNPIFAAVMKREDMKARFTEIMEELMEGALSPEHFAGRAEELAEQRRPEVLQYLRFLAAGDAQQEEALLAGKDEAALYEEYYREVLEQEEKLREFAKLRPETMRAELERLKDY